MTKLLESLFLDIIQFADRIGEYINGYGFDDFVIDNKTQDAVLKNIENIGIAAKRIREQYPEVLEIFPDIVNYEVVWRTITEDIPAFRVQVVETLDNLNTLPAT